MANRQPFRGIYETAAYYHFRLVFLCQYKTNESHHDSQLQYLNSVLSLLVIGTHCFKNTTFLNNLTSDKYCVYTNS